MRKAVVLLSGGLDSATAGAIARADGYELHALTVRYGQRHAVELEASRRVARAIGVASHREVELPLFGGSALTDASRTVPKDRTLDTIGAPGDIPDTYVPARNAAFLALALSLAETLGARALVIGVNVLDASGYPDCRPQFVDAFEKMANVATRADAADPFRVLAPLIRMTKAEIIRRGVALGVDYGLTHSCYDPVGDRACGRCDACALRKKGFAEANVPDPTPYAAKP